MLSCSVDGRETGLPAGLSRRRASGEALLFNTLQYILIRIKLEYQILYAARNLRETAWNNQKSGLPVTED